MGLGGADEAEAWAAFVHQQRFSEDYREARDGLGMALILHLARLADDYALPHEIEDSVDPTQPQPADSPAEDPLGQLAFEFDLDEGENDE